MGGEGDAMSRFNHIRECVFQFLGREGFVEQVEVIEGYFDEVCKERSEDVLVGDGGFKYLEDLIEGKAKQELNR